MKKEFVIWGVRKNGTEEELLLTQVQGIKIYSVKEANFYVTKLAELGCTGLRVQEVDLTTPPKFR